MPKQRPKRARIGIESSACLDLFVLRVNELRDTAIAKRGFSFKLWPGDDSVKDAAFPDRDDFTAFIVFFRQFFLHTSEPVEVHRVATAFRKCVADDELLARLSQLEPFLDAPFQSSLSLNIGGRQFSPRDLMEAWVSRYLHCDNIPPELMTMTGSEWQFGISPLMQYFYVGIQVLVRLKALVLEAKDRGVVKVGVSSNGPVA